MAKNISKEQFKNFRSFLIKYKTSNPKIPNIIDLSDGQTYLRQTIDNYLIQNDLEDEWIIFGKLLVKSIQFEKPSLKIIESTVFDVSSESKFEIFKNFIAPEILKEEAKQSDIEEKFIEEIRNSIVEELSDELKEILLKYFKNQKNTTDKEKCNLIFALKELTNKKTNEKIPTTTAYQLLNINNQYYKINLKKIMESSNE